MNITSIINALTDDTLYNALANEWGATPIHEVMLRLPSSRRIKFNRLVYTMLFNHMGVPNVEAEDIAASLWDIHSN